MHSLTWRLRFSGLLAVCALAPACAHSERPADNGQSHWLRSCEDDADCGGLSCLCGVCTTACSDDSACEQHADGDAVCRSAEALPSAAACSEAKATLELCLPAVLLVSDAGGAADTVAMTARDAATDARGVVVEPVEPRDSSMPIEPADGSTPPDVSRSIHLDCETIANGALPPGVERIGGEGEVRAIAVAGSTAAWTDQEGLKYQPSPDAEIETLVRGLSDRLEAYGGELFFTLSPLMEPTTALAMYSLHDRGGVVNLAYDESILNIPALAVDGANVYWASDTGQGDTITLWRSRNRPETSEIIGTAAGISPSALNVMGDWLYFPVGLDNEERVSQLYRLRTDGSAPAEALGDPQEGLRVVFGDANELFALITTGSGTPGLPRGDNRVVRIDPEDGSMQTLFETQRAWMGAVDETYVYWIANASFDTETVAIWRGRRDGTGQAIQLAEGWYYGGGWSGTAISDDSIYFSVTCSAPAAIGNLLRMVKPDP